MTPKPESETDPWAAMVTLRQLSSERGTPRFDAAIAEVEVAIAAEAAQHQQEIAYFKDFRDSVAAALCVENEQGPVDPSAIVEAADSTLSQLFDFSARLAAVEAERDQAQRALATAYFKARRQASVCEPNEDQFAGAMAVVAAAFPNTRVEATAIRIAKPEEPTELVVAVKRRAERAEAERDQLQNQIIDLGARVAIADEERAEAVAIRVERDRLKAALQGLQSDIEHDAHVNQPEAFRNYWRGRLHSEIAALTPQGQSTDGETR